MLASELIDKISEQIRIHGNLPVQVISWGSDICGRDIHFDSFEIEVTSDAKESKSVVQRSPLKTEVKIKVSKIIIETQEQ